MATPQTEASTKKAINVPKDSASKAAASAKNAKKPQAKAPPKSKAKAAEPAQPVAKKTEAATRKTPAPVAENTVKTKAKRVKKEKVVRDSFTMPKSDYAKLASLKQKCLDNGLRVKKSELLRAALTVLDAAPEKRIIAAIKALETVKTGRPAND